jgi:glycerol-3-phosphate cytidylyltransferase
VVRTCQALCSLEKCGYVAGMFDIFHIGHLSMLKLAKKKCEYLIVAVSTDNFYRQRKKREPIMPYAERRKIVEAIRYVDKVVTETNLDKIADYHKYNFDVMFAGYVKRGRKSSTLLRKYFEQ